MLEVDARENDNDIADKKRHKSIANSSANGKGTERYVEDLVFLCVCIRILVCEHIRSGACNVWILLYTYEVKCVLL